MTPNNYAITLTEILTTYWSQTTLLLLGLGYLGKRILDTRSRKVEINHSLFQQKRLESVNTFFTNYAKAEQMWTSIAILDILKNRIESKEIDQIIYPHINELERNILELQIYFKESDHKHFAEITDNLHDINRKLKKIYFEYSPDNSVINKSNEFRFHCDDKLKENKNILKKLSPIIRATFE